MAKYISQSDAGVYDSGNRQILLGLAAGTLLATASSTANSMVFGQTLMGGESLVVSSISKLGDSITTETCDVDEYGRPTINNARMGFYSITFSVAGGANQTFWIGAGGQSLTNAEAAFTPYAKDSEGFFIIPEVQTDDLIYYCDPSYSGGGTPKGYLLNDAEVGGDSQNPVGAVVPYTDPDNIPQLRDNYSDRVYFARGQVYSRTNSFTIPAGRSDTSKAMYMAYGTGARPILRRLGSGRLFDSSSGRNNTGWDSLTFVNPDRDPNDALWPGFDTVSQGTSAIRLYPGGGNSRESGFIIQNCQFSYGQALDSSGGGGIGNLIFRRNLAEWSWSHNGHIQGFFSDYRTSQLNEENLYYHNGWLTQSYAETGTATGGDATHLIDTSKNWSADQWYYTGLAEGILVHNMKGGASDFSNRGEAASNTSDTITFSQVAGNPSFQAGDDYILGGNNNQPQGLATIFNHHNYHQPSRSIFRNNWLMDACSNNIKLVAYPDKYPPYYPGDDRAWQTADSGSTSHLVDLDEDFINNCGTNGNQQGGENIVGWAVKDRTNGGWAVITSRTATRIDFTVQQGVVDFSSGVNEYHLTNENVVIDPDNPRSGACAFDVHQYNNVCYRGELSLGGYGNDVGFEGVGYRIKNHCTWNNYIEGLGDSRPTNRTLAFGIEHAGIDTGISGLNIQKGFGQANANVTNISGQTFRGWLKDFDIMLNIDHDFKTGRMLFDENDDNTFSGVRVWQNDFQAPTGSPYAADVRSGQSGLDYNANSFDTQALSTAAAKLDGVDTTLTAMASGIGDTNAVIAAQSYPDTTKGIASWLQSKGEPGLDPLEMVEIFRAMDRGNWDESFMPDNMISYARSGFGFPTR